MWSPKVRKSWHITLYLWICCYSEYVVKNAKVTMYTSGDSGAVIRSSFQSEFYMRIYSRRSMEAKNLMCCTSFAMSICEESGTMWGGRDIKGLTAWGFTEPGRSWLLPSRDVTSIICDWLGTILTACISSPNVVGDGVAAVMCVWGFTTAGTFVWATLNFISRSQMLSDASPSSWLRQFI